MGAVAASGWALFGGERDMAFEMFWEWTSSTRLMNLLLQSSCYGALGLAEMAVITSVISEAECWQHLRLSRLLAPSARTRILHGGHATCMAKHTRRPAAAPSQQPEVTFTKTELAPELSTNQRQLGKGIASNHTPLAVRMRYCFSDRSTDPASLHPYSPVEDHSPLQISGFWLL